MNINFTATRTVDEFQISIIVSYTGRRADLYVNRGERVVHTWPLDADYDALCTPEKAEWYLSRSLGAHGTTYASYLAYGARCGTLPATPCLLHA